MKEFEVALGTKVFDPSDAAPLRRRSIGARAADAPDPNDTRIVQFVRPLTGPDIDRIRAAYGLALTAYVPNLAYIERVDDATRRRLGRDELVRAVAPYRPEYKLDALVQQRIASGELGREPVVATLFSGGSIPLVSEALQQAGATDVTSSDHRSIGISRVMFVTDDPAVVGRASQLPDIRYLELAARITRDDVAASAVIQSGDATNASVWARGIHGEGQIIGQLENDTPNIAHAFLADAAPNVAGAAHRKVVDLRAGGTDDPTLDPCARFHATFVAGCAVGDERGNSGAHPNRGSAWAAKLAAGTVSLAVGSTLTELTNNMNAGAFVHTNSWHDGRHGNGVPAPYNHVAVDVDLFCYNNEDHVVLGSSGNVGNEQGPPGTAKNALCVSAAAVNGTQIGEGIPGPTADGRRKPDIVAAGCDITSSIGTGSQTRNCGCATSWATPHAAGAAALVRQYFTEGWYPTGTKGNGNAFVPSSALLRAMLVNSAVNMTGVANYPNNTEGWGLIRIDRALMFNDNGRNLIVRDFRNSVGLHAGEEWTQPYNVTPIVGGGAQQLRVVLAYTDPPGTTAAPLALVNDLDLEVTDPNGVKYVGNDFDTAAGFSRPNSTALGDSLNTIECVMVAAPVAGVWEVKVKAWAVPSGPQGFALAVTCSGEPDCFVATAVYGDPWHADVVALRSWRDEALAAGGLRGAAMRVLSTIYVVLGPPAARAVTRMPGLRDRLRRAVFPAFVARIETRRTRQHRGGER